MFKSLKQTAFNKFKKAETDLHELNYLFWECTTRCNLNCLHCGSDCSKDSSYNDMPLEDFLKSLDTIETQKDVITVVITGGEPLVRKDLEQCGQEIRKRGMRWAMVSNGQLYDEKRHNSLINAGLGALTISLDGLEKSHNWLRNSTTNFDRVGKAISLATSYPRLNFDIVTCVNKKNIDELPDILEYLVKKNVKSWRLFTIVPIGRAVDNPELFLSDKEFTKMLDFISTTRKQKLIDIKFSCEGYVGDYELKVRDTFFFCRAGINIGSILIDGSISACPNIDRSFAQGNIYKDNFFEVWQTKFQMFRNRAWTKVGKCANCSEYKNCQGNGLHYWTADKDGVMLCHNEKII
jgi:radical SAM enzyme (rSAM/lipoprotein system)